MSRMKSRKHSRQRSETRHAKCTTGIIEVSQIMDGSNRCHP